MKFSFNLKKQSVLNGVQNEKTYNLNMAINNALLSNDSTVIRKFFNLDIMQYLDNEWSIMLLKDTFLGHYEPGQAYAYFGLIPMIVQGKVNLIASNGFNCKSQNKSLEKALNKAIDLCDIQNLYKQGAFYESGFGDVAFRISYDNSVSKYPIIELIEPQLLEINYRRGKVKSIVIKRLAEDNTDVELCEIHSLNSYGYCQIDYKFRYQGKYVPNNDTSLIDLCKKEFKDISLESKVYPFRDLLVIYKQNDKDNILYKRERGVPDIQGLFTYEDGLSELISGLIDAVRKGGIKEYINQDLLPTLPDGTTLPYNAFNKRIMTTKGSSNPAENQQLITVTQAQIPWESYIKPIQTIMSVAINKAGLSPTTLGITGLESINSSQESQDAREKPSMRLRNIALSSWKLVLTKLLNIWLQVYDYINGDTLTDYTDLIDIQFNEYTNPTTENVTDLLLRQVNGGIKSIRTAISELNKGMSEEEINEEFNKIMADKNGVIQVERNEEIN